MNKWITVLFFVFIPITMLSQEVKKVLIIGIDGCRSDALEIANTPTIDALVNNGVFSPDALNDDITISGPGWSANLCGVWSDKHQVVNNNFSSNNYEEYPHFYSYVEGYDDALNTVSICHWNPINDFIASAHADVLLNVPSDEQVSSEAISYITQNDPDVLFLHYDDVDHAGHSSGFSPDNVQYIEAIEEVDGFVGSVIEAIEERPTYENEDWLILVTTDHGGRNLSHGGNSIEEQNVFFIASGNSIPTQLIEKEIIEIDPPVNCLNDDPFELQFDGENDVVIVPPNELFDFGNDRDFTIECRVRTDVGGDVSIIGNKDWNSGLNTGFVLSFALPEGEQWKVNIGDGANRVDINTGGNILDNEWHTLSVSFDRDGLMKMFLDGQFVEEASIENIGNINTDSRLLFGTDSNNAFDYSGAIAEVRVWDRVVDEMTINSWHCEGIDESHPFYSDLIGYWKLNEGSGIIAVDASTYENHGAIQGADWGTPNTESYDYSNTPRITDIPYTALTHLCIPIEDEWDLDGESLIENCETLGLSSHAIEVSVFPNPTSDTIHIFIRNDHNLETSRLAIYTVTGKKVYEQESLNTRTSVHLDSLEKGIYFLKIKTDNYVTVKKIIKSD